MLYGPLPRAACHATLFFLPLRVTTVKVEALATWQQVLRMWKPALLSYSVVQVERMHNEGH